MEPEQFRRLVENVKIDGALTEIVLCCQNADGSLEILSGHHRQEAAIAADQFLIWVMVITTLLDEERKNAIQLSHNSIAGQDNPSILAQVYESLGLEAKKFSGLTDEILKGLEKIQVSALTAANVNYERLNINFLPEDLEEFDRCVKQIKERKQVALVYAARYADFDSIFNTVVEVKHKLGIVNSALALASMAELANERLDLLEAEKEAEKSAD